METRFQHSAKATAAMDTAELREAYLIQHLFAPGKVNLVYSHYDRMVIGGVVPEEEILSLDTIDELKADYFLQRRELGIINVGNTGVVTADGIAYTLQKLDCLYLGKGTREVIFASNDAHSPSRYYLLSTPAHVPCDNCLSRKEDAQPLQLGTQATGNVRTLYKYIHPGGILSCQLVMGLTILDNGSVWNSVPPHTHTRRMEVYFYFDVMEEHRVFHFMGEPAHTRHLVASNHEAVISPPWSVHFGAGTMNYGFIWGMAGENQAFDDMDVKPVATLL